MIQELEVFPQITYSENQGMVGVRKWTLDHDDNWRAFLDVVCKSHWPGDQDAIPIQVQYGAFDQSTLIKREAGSPRTRETLGDLPTYGKALVVAQYALQKITNCWPDKFPKPWHPPGTTLTLKVRGAGQFILIPPGGISKAASPVSACPQTVVEAAFLPARVIVPVTEYHITCGRMTRAQVNEVLGTQEGVYAGKQDWDIYQGTVNGNWFMGAPPQTLLFDGYELDETFACDEGTPHRYRLSCVLKQRVFVDEQGEHRNDGANWYIGWNHDFVNISGTRWGWQAIVMKNDRDECVPRYQRRNFDALFGGSHAPGEMDCLPSEGSLTEMTDCEFCGAADPTPDSESAVAQSSTSVEFWSPSESPSSVIESSEQPPSSSSLPPCP